jgi:hypothetical protein
MSRTPYGLAVAIIGKKEGKTKKCHARSLVWPCLPKAQNFKEKQKMSCTPYGLAVAIIGKKKGKTKNVTHTAWSGLDFQWAKI